MNRLLNSLHRYPFERMTQLLDGVEPASGLPLIAWSLGEPKHETPGFLVDALQNRETLIEGLGTYPPTRGIPALRQSIAAFITRRFQLGSAIDADSQVLPVNGSREALFAFAQAVIDPADPGLTFMPNPFYQIYEGAALLAGSRPRYINCIAESGFLPDLESIPEDEWRQCRLIYICSPGNPTGALMDKAMLRALIERSDEYGFIIASDECYSEVYFDEQQPPPGLLQVASMMGRNDFKNCIAFNSLSKRSNLPGLRSGYVAGDAGIIEKFLLYRTYHGSAMPVHHQHVSTLAWQDDEHVVVNRAIYRAKFEAVSRILSEVWPVSIPPGGFYLWPETPIDDTAFTVRLIETTNVKVLPGTFLSRDTPGGNPGTNRVRMALVAGEAECIEAAHRIVDNWSELQPPQ